MSVAFPATLPSLDRLGGLSVTFGDPVLRSQMSTGPAKTRPRFTAAPDSYVLGHPAYTRAQVDEFCQFRRNDLAYGALSFQMNDPLLGGLASFRFTSPPQFKPVGGGKWSLSINAEKLP